MALVEIDLIVKLHAIEPKSIGAFQLARRFRKALAAPKLDISALGVNDFDPPRATMDEQIRELLSSAIEQVGVDPKFADADQQLDEDIEAMRRDGDEAATSRLRRALTSVIAPKLEGGRPPEFPAALARQILDIWRRILGRQGGITVADTIARGPLITFADNCLRLAGFEAEYDVVRTDAIYAWLRRNKKRSEGL